MVAEVRRDRLTLGGEVDRPCLHVAVGGHLLGLLVGVAPGSLGRADAGARDVQHGVGVAAGAQVTARLGDRVGAEEALRKALLLNPSYREARGELNKAVV